MYITFKKGFFSRIASSPAKQETPCSLDVLSTLLRPVRINVFTRVNLCFTGDWYICTFFSNFCTSWTDNIYVSIYYPKQITTTLGLDQIRVICQVLLIIMWLSKSPCESTAANLKLIVRFQFLSLTPKNCFILPGIEIGNS